MSLALTVTRLIDEFSRRVGIVAIYLVLASSLVSAFNAFFRYSTNGLMWLEQETRTGIFGWMIDIYRENSNAPEQKRARKRRHATHSICPRRATEKEKTRMASFPRWGAIPWLVLQLVMVGILIAWPGLVTFFLDSGTGVDPDTIDIIIPGLG